MLPSHEFLPLIFILFCYCYCYCFKTFVFDSRESQNVASFKTILYIFYEINFSNILLNELVHTSARSLEYIFMLLSASLSLSLSFFRSALIF